MGKILRFQFCDQKIKPFGQKIRPKLSQNGCNEPFKDRFWCPEKGWFTKEPCPFVNQHECRSFKRLCGIH